MIIYGSALSDWNSSTVSGAHADASYGLAVLGLLCVFAAACL